MGWGIAERTGNIPPIPEPAKRDIKWIRDNPAASRNNAIRSSIGLVSLKGIARSWD